MHLNYSHTLTLRRSRQEIIADAETPHFNKSSRIPKSDYRARDKNEIIDLCREFKRNYRDQVNLNFGEIKDKEFDDSSRQGSNFIQMNSNYKDRYSRGKEFKIEELRRSPVKVENIKLQAPDWRRLDQTQA